MIPFVILSTIRSGSTYLTRMLNNHPAVVCNGEVFNPDDPDYNWPSEPPRTTEEMLQAAFVDYPLRGHDGADVEAVGCKLGDGHVFTSPGRLARLICVPGMRFIILQRRNQFECLRSWMQAQVTDTWQSRDIPAPPVTLSPSRCRIFFEQAEAFYGHLSQLIPPGQRVWLDYEQLRAQTDMVLAHLWKFLEVPPWSPSPQLAKLEERPLKETVENYSELQLVFQGTDYGIFLP